MSSEKIKLRALTKDDAKVSWPWRNTDAIRYFYSGHPFFINLEKEEAWIEKIAVSDLPLTSFGIEEMQSNSLIGMSFLKDINLIHRTAEFAIFIGDDNAKGKGYAKEATLKTITFAFNNLNLHRVFLKVQEDNHSAIKLYEKCHFKKEGTLRECVYKNGHYVNEVIMAILKNEFLLLS
ncbi:GNAT family N-acetyltransferase [Aquimarina sp. U1-2]|uniref:GNAT family N-acetyltransferase n=1 Tax=Aquimarina sp. U1-2 TaxID=2823141 RepID=UPI001AECA9D9|nr:GNAT family protein [Aquimarina sp. U1-2]MBP2833680.1 GNAT family N-acetyltransferase [Aquimarina sp. U1-2]